MRSSLNHLSHGFESTTARLIDGEDPEELKALGLFIRYQNAAERNFHKAHAELVKARQARKKSEIGFEPKSQPQTLQPNGTGP